MRFVFIIIALTLIPACNTTKVTLSNKYYTFKDASERSTAYVENSKIVSSGDYTFISFLNRINNKYKIHIVMLYKEQVSEERTLDEVPTSHGGGSIALKKDGTLCMVFGGHIEKLQYKCASKPYSISDWAESTTIDPNLNKEVFQTYPSIQFHNDILHLTYREETKNPDIRNPSLIHMKIYQDNSYSKNYIKSSDSYYANYTASLFIKNNRIDILSMGFTINNGVSSNTGVFLHRSKDTESFNEETIIYNPSLLDKNTYNSNLVGHESNIYFLIIDRQNPQDLFNLYIVDKDNHKTVLDLTEYKAIQNIFNKGYQPNVRASIGVNSNGDIFIALPFINKDNTDWKSPKNRVSYFKLSKNLKDMNLIFSENQESWLVNIDKSITKNIPKIIYNLPNKNTTVLRIAH